MTPIQTLIHALQAAERDIDWAAIPIAFVSPEPIEIMKRLRGLLEETDAVLAEIARDKAKANK